MDELDLRLMNMLYSHGRMTWSELAGHLELSAPSTAERVRRLEEKGVIKGYHAEINFSSLGLTLTSFVFVSLAHPKYRKEFVETIQQFSEVEECHHITGDDDYLLKVLCRDTKHLDDFLTHQLKEIGGVSKTRTTIALSTIKKSPMKFLSEVQSMFLSLLIKGTLIGFSIAMPVGPIGLLCVRNSLTRGAIYGFFTGLGAALADAVYGAIAGFGVVSLMSLLISYQLALQIGGGLFLCYLGVKTYLAKEAEEKAVVPSKGYFNVFFSTFFLTLTNPMTILSFIGIYTSLGIGVSESRIEEALILTGGVFLGSAFWWLLLSSASARFKERLNASKTRWLNRLSGMVLIGFGVSVLLYI